MRLAAWECDGGSFLGVKDSLFGTTFVIVLCFKEFANNSLIHLAMAYQPLCLTTAMHMHNKMTKKKAVARLPYALMSDALHLDITQTRPHSD